MMLDDIRRQADAAYKEEDYETGAGGSAPGSKRSALRLGPFQRFFIALLLLMMACMLGSLCLLATGRVVPPF